MTANCTCLCRDLKPLNVEGEARPWVHVAQIGEFPGDINIPAGYDVPGFGVVAEDLSVAGTTVVTDANLGQMIQSFSGDVLIDYEHFSHDKDKSTEAAGWGIEIRYTADRVGAELQTEWAVPARKQIVEKVYRHLSPEYSGYVKYENGDFKFFPTALTGAGLTNRPKLKVLRPVSANRENKPPSTNIMDYKSELCKSLGLDPATATDAEIAAAMGTSTATSNNRETRLTTLKAENAQLKAAAVEHDLEIYADVIEDKEAAKDLLQMNRDSAVKFFKAAQAKKGTGTQEPLHQRNRAVAPKGESTAADDEKATAKYRQISGRATQLANEAKASGKSRDWNCCWSQAEGEAGV